MPGASDETPLSRLRRATERGHKLLGGQYRAEEALQWWQPTQVAFRLVFGGDSELVKQMIEFRPRLLQKTASVAEINEYHSRALHVLASLESLSGAHPAHAAPRVIPSTKNVFVIHGHDELNTRRLTDILRKRGDGVKPVLMMNEPGRSRPLIRKFEDEAGPCSYAVALYTADDSVTNGGRTYSQARPNGLFEIGWFVGRLGHDRVLVLRQKSAEIHSDFAGVSVIPFDSDVQTVEAQVADELRAAGLAR